MKFWYPLFVQFFQLNIIIKSKDILRISKVNLYYRYHKYHNFSSRSDFTDMLEIPQVLQRNQNLWYIADIIGFGNLLIWLRYLNI